MDHYTLDRSQEEALRVIKARERPHVDLSLPPAAGQKLSYPFDALAESQTPVKPFRLQILRTPRKQIPCRRGRIQDPLFSLKSIILNGFRRRLSMEGWREGQERVVHGG